MFGGGDAGASGSERPGRPGTLDAMSAVPDPARPEPDEEPTRSSTIKAAIRTARPKQWTKNVLVFAAPAAAGVLDQGGALLRTTGAFVAFCLAASGTYFLNDAMDAEADRLHPTKRHRPIAAGHLDPTTARRIAVLLVVLALAVAAPINGGQLAAVVAGYVAVTL